MIGILGYVAALVAIRLAWYAYDLRQELDAYHDVMTNEIDTLGRYEKRVERRERDVAKREAIADTIIKCLGVAP